MEEFPRFEAVLRTTQAVDLVQGGVKVNALPEKVSAVVNHRIAEHSSVAELKEHFVDVVVPAAARFNLSVEAFGKNVSAGSSKGGHVVLSDAFGTGLEPSPVTPMGEHDPYHVLAGTIKSTIETAEGYNASGVVVAPLLQLGNTDTRYYWNLTRNIVRYKHLRDTDRFNGAHTVNEAVRAAGWIESIRFLTNICGVERLTSMPSTPAWLANQRRERNLIGRRTLVAAFLLSLCLVGSTLHALVAGGRPPLLFSSKPSATRLPSGLSQTDLNVDGPLLSDEASSACPQPKPLVPSRLRALDEQLQELFANETYRLEAYKAFGGAIKIPTESYEDLLPVGEDHRWDIFDELHEYLEKTFARVYEGLNVTKVNTYGIVLHWQGSDEAALPVLMTAHQDVVPVDPATYGEWVHPPYSGYYDGTWIWGRGSCDDKSDLVASLQAVKTLLELGFQPRRTFVWAFGFDEESAGTQVNNAECSIYVLPTPTNHCYSGCGPPISIPREEIRHEWLRVIARRGWLRIRNDVRRRRRIRISGAVGERLPRRADRSHRTRRAF
ncbi:hypothetical protein NUW54_g11373 [Trametes sanguinea]|uniref:Uncharacterized protein n=1 Tax=Trametes sanguinea TaxID=158606 RepID=A0ACC1NFR5_9APHY|nr:hypothetical protein NUW54_g11373 [Trametes sanguinea]